MTDLAWSADGNILVVSSTDGYCTIIKFNQGELGELYCEKLSTETPMEIDFIPDKVDIADDHKENNANFTPKSKSLTSSAKKKLRRESLAEAKALESKSVMVIDEAAMEPWSENNVVKSTESVLKPQIVNTIEEATEDLKLVYEESQSDILDKKDKVDQKTNSSIAECVSSVISQKKDDLPNTLDSSKQVMSPLSLPKTPRRVNFITLSSPKSKKKLI